MLSRFPRYCTGKTLALVLLILIAMCIPPVTAIAVSGAKFMETVKPGSTVSFPMTVSIKANDDPTDIQVDVLGFGQGMDKSYTPLKPADDISPYSARSFITVDNSSIHLEPGASKTITAKISVPANVGQGGRYALIYIHALPGQGKSVTTAIIVPVMLTISGTSPTDAGSIVDLSISGITQGQPISVVTTLKNTGNYHYYKTVNSVDVRDATGNVMGNGSTEPSIFAIIPGNTIKYATSLTLNDLPSGMYTVTSRVLLESGVVLDEKTTTFTIDKNYIPPVTESNITLTPGNSGTLITPDGRYSISFPQGAVLGDAVVTLKPYSKERLPTAPVNAKLGATSFEITGLSGLLSKDATIQVPYSEDDLTAAGGDTSLLKLAYYDAVKKTWIILPTQVDTGNKKLTATTNHLSVWTVMISSSTTSSTAEGVAPVSAETKKSPVPIAVILTSFILSIAAYRECSKKRI